MEKKVFFAGAIRGDRSSAETTIIGLIKFIREELRYPVLNEHVGAEDPIGSFAEKIGKEKDSLQARDIEEQDIAWLNQCSHVIAEISGASTGTGREIEYARTKGHFENTPAKILCLYRIDREFYASPMIRGMTPDRYPEVTVKSYENLQGAKKLVREFLA